jgi:hypothetical protein
MNRIIIILLFLFAINSNIISQEQVKTIKPHQAELQKMENEKDSLVILWTSGDPDVALKMVFMYTNTAAKNSWWKEVNLIIWGPSSKLPAENLDIQKKISEMRKNGVKIEACKACADQYGVADKLVELGIEVKYMGEPLTEILKSNKKLVTF